MKYMRNFYIWYNIAKTLYKYCKIIAKILENLQLMPGALSTLVSSNNTGPTLVTVQNWWKGSEMIEWTWLEKTRKKGWNGDKHTIIEGQTIKCSILYGRGGTLRYCFYGTHVRSTYICNSYDSSSVVSTSCMNSFELH